MRIGPMGGLHVPAVEGLQMVTKAVRLIRQLAAQADTEALPDDELLRRCLIPADRHSALAAIFDRHGPMVFGVCRLYSGQAQDADDAFQETFLALLKKVQTIRPG